jgi:hypothetical protein
MTRDKTRLLIIGGVAAGATAAARARRISEAAEITLLERGPYVSYANCGLPYFLSRDIEQRQKLLLQTPEGFARRYRVTARMDHLASTFYKALLIDYPNAEDRTEFSGARRRGEIPPSARVGGLIEIHGGGGRQRDWTDGCVAVTNREIQELFGRVSVGTPVTIVGSDTYGAIAEFAERYRQSATARRP